jgi:septin family protein
MKALHHKVNIVPIIAKADTLTLNEVKSLKQKVMQYFSFHIFQPQRKPAVKPTNLKSIVSQILDEIDELNINVYHFPECDSDDDETFLALNADLKVLFVCCLMQCRLNLLEIVTTNGMGFSTLLQDDNSSS